MMVLLAYSRKSLAHVVANLITFSIYMEYKDSQIIDTF